MARDQVSVGGIAVRKWSFVLVAVSLVTLRVQAKVVVFWQPGFPTVASQPIEKAMLDKALKGLQPVFADEAALGASETLANCELLPPYGSAVPVESWKSMERYLDGGGNLLVIGGQPLHVPVSLVNGKFVPANRQDTYARELGFRHTYEVLLRLTPSFNGGPVIGGCPQLQCGRKHGRFDRFVGCRSDHMPATRQPS